MITDYQSRKNEVLDSYETVEKLVECVKKNAQLSGVPNPLERLDALLTDIRIKSEKVRADRFSLMIAGESKSGKSTFINAYLGVDLMPMDVKQCTSAIIEIKNGEKFYVRATYANGRTEEIEGDAKARDFLKKNAALDDDYRDIPVPTINSELLVKSGKKAITKGGKIYISNHDVEDLLNAPEVKAANIHNMPSDEYNKKIRDYIEKNKKTWQNIVTKIEVIYPFSEEMRGIEIVDSPGVYARGGVAEITSKYIENADAIIFLKPISGQALESTQFNQFISSTSVERNKNTLFLILTRATDLTPDDLRRQESEAYKQFSNLDKQKILIVDSKAEYYAKKLVDIENDNIEHAIRQLSKDGTLDHFVKSAYFDTNEKDDFINILQKMSRFEHVYNALEIFGRNAHYILLGSLLDSISDFYEKLWNDLNTHLEMFSDKAEDPTELARKIANIKQELDAINNKMYKGVDKVVRRFLADDGIIRITADKAVKEFKTKTSTISADSYKAFEELEHQSLKKIDEFKELTETLQKNVVSECDKELVALSDNSSIPFESLKPNFTDKTFDEIRNSTQSKATESYEYEDGVTFTKTRTRSKYSQNKHYEIIKKNIMTRLEDIKNDLISNLSDFTENIRSRYIKELSLNADAKKKELDAIMEAKISAEQTAEIIKELTSLTGRIVSAKSCAEKLQGGIVKNVQ